MLEANEFCVLVFILCIPEKERRGFILEMALVENTKGGFMKFANAVKCGIYSSFAILFLLGSVISFPVCFGYKKVCSATSVSLALLNTQYLHIGNPPFSPVLICFAKKNLVVLHLGIFFPQTRLVTPDKEKTRKFDCSFFQR
jgi:hypothetical protein